MRHVREVVHACAIFGGAQSVVPTVTAVTAVTQVASCRESYGDAAGILKHLVRPRAYK